MPLGDRDVQRLGPCVAVNHALLTVQAGLGLECYILVERQAYQGVKCCAGGKKVFSKFFQHHWAENDVANQALSASLAKSNGEG